MNVDLTVTQFSESFRSCKLRNIFQSQDGVQDTIENESQHQTDLTWNLPVFLAPLGVVVLGADELTGVAETLAPVGQVERGGVAGRRKMSIYQMNEADRSSD